MKVLELYSGIGGMHFALERSGISGEVVCSVDINNFANKVYQCNFPKTYLLNRNIQNLTSEFINKLNVDMILMSPPCQPFTRNGLKGDITDPRTDSFIHILKVLPETSIKYILIENVKGFEASNMRNILVRTLEESDYVYQEFILSPTQFGIPNTRHRYYCLVKKKPERFCFETSNLMCTLPYNTSSEIPFPLSEIVDPECTEKYKISDEVLKKRLRVMDLCGSDSTRSCCFTKGYGRYIEGTGSVYSNKTESEINVLLNNLKKCALDSDEYLECAKMLNLRFFTPLEVCRLMCFPNSFKFPIEITDKQKYMLLGNSINVKVVSELIKLLVNR